MHITQIPKEKEEGISLSLIGIEEMECQGFKSAGSG